MVSRTLRAWITFTRLFLVNRSEHSVLIFVFDIGPFADGTSLRAAQSASRLRHELTSLGRSFYIAAILDALDTAIRAL